MSREFKLLSGRVITLKELRQTATYEGLLEGLPTVEKNKGLIQRLLNDRSLKPYEVDPVLLPAVERPIELPPEHSYPFGTPSALPAVTVFARFTSHKSTVSGTGDASGLVVVWFQEQFAFPPAEDIASQLQNLDWERYAGNFEY